MKSKKAKPKRSAPPTPSKRPQKSDATRAGSALTKTTARVAQPARVVTAEVAAGSAEGSVPPLNSLDQKLLAEALRRGEAARDGMEDVLRDYGSWLFVNLFDSNSSKVIEARREHPVWRHLVARAGGPTLRLNEPMLAVCLLTAAYDKRLNDDSWRALDMGRKQLLLRLKTDEQMRKGAHHVLAAKLTWRATREYVRNSLETQGEPTEIRVRVGQVQQWLQGIHERLMAGGFQAKLETAAQELPKTERKKLHRQIDTLQQQLAALAKRLSP